MIHGTTNAYRNGCRCDLCRTVHAAAQREGREVRRAMLNAGAVEPEHGSRSTYVNYHCRCRRCCRAQAEHDAARTREDRHARP